MIIFRSYHIKMVRSNKLINSLPAYELGMKFPYCNDSKLVDKGCPWLSFVHIFSIDTHQPSKHYKLINN